MKTDESFNFERFKEEAIQGLYEGRKMGGTDGVFAPMLKRYAAAASSGIYAGG